MLVGVVIGGIITFAFQVKAERVTYTAEEEPVVHKEVLIEVETEEDKIIRRIKETFPEDPENAVRIAECESGFRKEVVSPTNDHGLMQINLTVHEDDVEALGIDVYSVEDNLKFARMLYDEIGPDGQPRHWKPWVCARLLGII